MKKFFAMLLVGCLAVAMFTGCSGGNESEPEAPTLSGEIEVIQDAQEDEVEVVPEGMARSYLTGEWIDEELAAKRPIAVMLGNTTAALPQYGIGEAEVIYEVPVEGGLVRLMAIIQDYENLEKLMSIRSCRHYFVHWAMEYDAIYTHYGQAYLAEDILKQSYVDNINGLDGTIEYIVFSRDNSRKAPHNAYSNGEDLAAGIAKKGYDTALDASYEGHFLFDKDDNSEITLDNGTEATYIKPGYAINKPWFEYNAEDGLYYRYQHNAAHIDAVDGDQLACKNIILQVCDWSVADKEQGYLDINTTSGGHGYYVTNGKVVPITWSKDSITATTNYYGEDGSEIVLNQGKTWICIIQNTYENEVTFVEE